MANDHNPVLEADERSDETESRSPNVGELRWELELLGHERRRQAIRMLEGDEASSLARSELARRIAAAETDAAAPDERLVRRIELALHHKHLPMLDEYGVVDYDPDTGLATYAPSQKFERQVLAAVK